MWTTPALCWYNGRNKKWSTNTKLTSIEEVLAKLDKDTLKKFRMASDIERRFIPTPSLGLNLLLGGGFSRGHQTTLWGNESAGKSTFLLEMIGQNQQRDSNFSAAYLDTEKTLDPVWAKRLGCDTDKLIVGNQSTISETTDIIGKWIEAGIDLIVVDSLSNLMPKSFFGKDGEMKEFDKTGQIGQQARELGQMCRMIQGRNFETTIVFISQVRLDLGVFIPGEKPSGGKEVGHLDSLRVKLTSSKSEAKALKGEIQHGDILIEEIIGRVVKWQINKNKINGRYGVGEYNLITQGERVGLEAGAELRDYGVLYGIVEKVGNSRFIINGESIHGKDNAANYIIENPDISEFLAGEIERVLTVHSTPVESEDD